MSALRVLFTTLLHARFECVSVGARSPRGTKIIGCLAQRPLRPLSGEVASVAASLVS